MPFLAYFLIILTIILLIVILFLILIKTKQIKELSENKPNDRLFELLNQNVLSVQQQLGHTSDSLNQRLDKAAQVISAVNRELGSMSEIGRNIKDFQALLNAPKLRGNLGETILYDTLAQTLPASHYETQFKFKAGQTVDAIIRTNSGIICIDSKFPMENFVLMSKTDDPKERERQLKDFVRQVKKHIDDIEDKYILPSEGTLEYAVMYVPSEKVFYEIVMESEDLLQYAHDRHVLLVSPNTFLYYLRTVMMGLERGKIQEEAKRIIETLKSIQNENKKFGEAIQLVNRHLTNAKNAMDSASNQYEIFSHRVNQVQLLSSGEKRNEDLTDSNISPNKLTG